MVLMFMIVTLVMVIMTLPMESLAPAAGTRAGSRVFVSGAGLLLGHQGLLPSVLRLPTPSHVGKVNHLHEGQP